MKVWTMETNRDESTRENKEREREGVRVTVEKSANIRK